MAESHRPRVAIVDYEMGNLFSVKHACQHAGMEGMITSARQDILGADAVVLPGVGAFGDAMDTLRRLDLVGVLQEVAHSPKPFLGVCLGMQLLMTESYEFGRHRGLGIIDGPVVRFDNPTASLGYSNGQRPATLKVPQVGWNQIFRVGRDRDSEGASGDPWRGTLLSGLQDGEFMYFVHSFYAEPEDPSVVAAVSRYGSVQFCSSLVMGNLLACQFHPERSGPQGLRVYQNLAALICEQQGSGNG